MTKNTLYNYLNELVTTNVVPGMVLSIITKESRELFFVGKNDDKTYTSVDTIYDLASVSKVVGTLSGILKLIENNKISLDTKLKDILVHYKHESTIKDLLTHQSGLPADDKAYRNCKSKEEFIDFVYNLELTYTPQSSVEYTDFGYILLGFVIEHFEGSIESYLSDILFEPLKMNHTTYIPSKLDQSLIAPSEKHVDRGVIQGVVMDGKAHLLNGLSGNAGIFSNINDLSNYVQMILNGGSLFGTEVFQSSTIDLLKNSYTEGLNVNRTLGYGLKDDSFSQGHLSSDHIIYHTGFSGPMVLIDFENKMGIVCLTNRTYPNRTETRIIKERNTLIDNIYTYIGKNKQS